MFSFNKAAAIGIIATGILGAVVGYYFFFRKRCTNSLFAQAQRMQVKQNATENRSDTPTTTTTTATTTRRPMLMSNAEIKQLFFAQEVHLGEQEFSRGNFAGGSKHFALAVTVYEHPERFLQILQQALPAPVFIMILQEIQVIQREIEIGRKLEREHFHNSSSKMEEL